MTHRADVDTTSARHAFAGSGASAVSLSSRIALRRLFELDPRPGDRHLRVVERSCQISRVLSPHRASDMATSLIGMPADVRRLDRSVHLHRRVGCSPLR